MTTQITPTHAYNGMHAYSDNVHNDTHTDHPTEDVCKCLICFTDGACIHNGKKHAQASYAVVWPEHPEMNYAQKLSHEQEHTNNRAEFTAVIHAFEQADAMDPGRTVPLHVYTDSMLLINSLTKWMNAWKRNGWRKADGTPVANRDLLETLYAHVAKRVAHFRHVRAHTNKKDWESTFNDYADQCAKVALHGSNGSGSGNNNTYNNNNSKQKYSPAAASTSLRIAHGKKRAF